MSQPRGERDDEIHRITDAARPHSDDLNARIQRYLISMAIRTVCVILAVVVPSPWRWVFVAGAIGLPYVAVVMANNKAGTGRRSPVITPTTRRSPLPPPGPGEGPGPHPNG